MKFRRAVDSDMAWLANEWSDRRNLESIHPMMNNPLEIEDSVKNVFIYPNRVLIMANDDNSPIGLAQLDISSFKKHSHVAFFCMLINRDYRGKGLGTKLLHELMRMAKDEFKIEVLFLDVFSENRAINLYKRVGFVQCGSEARFMKEGLKYLEKVCMYKEL